MTVSCPDCRSVFRVDPAKVPATGVRARCSVCGGVIAIAGGTLPVSVTPASSSVVLPALAGVSAANRAGTAGSSGGSIGAPVASAAANVTAIMPSNPRAAFVQPLRTSAAAAALKPMATPSLATGAIDRGTISGSVERLTPSAPRKPINPFLNADPGQRARRLARALVSDLVAYHPQKREEGLRDGTLRQLFREEIKKSYEEFVEQVGRDLAESSPHFQEALNEILGGGRKLF